MSNQICFPIDNDGWIPLKGKLGNKILVRAVSIKVKKQRVSSRNQHGVDEAEAEGSAEGSVRIRSKYYNISGFPTNT